VYFIFLSDYGASQTSRGTCFKAKTHNTLLTNKSLKNTSIS